MPGLSAIGRELRRVQPVQHLTAGADARLQRQGARQQTAEEEFRGGALAGIEIRLLGVALLGQLDRKSTRLNSSHVKISYAVFCLKKKNKFIDVVSMHLLN